MLESIMRLRGGDFLGLMLVAAVLVSGLNQAAHAHTTRARLAGMDHANDLASPHTLPREVDRVAVQASFGRLPLYFEAHEDENAFLSRGQGYTLVLRPFEALLSLRTSAGGSQSDEAAKPAPKLVHMQLQGGASAPHVEGLTPLRGKVNYLLGNDPAKWRTGIPTYGKVHYRDVYPGIDLVYYGNQDKLEFDFVVAPGSEPETIQLLFRGVEEARIDAQGDLVLGTGAGIRLRAPTLYQEFEGKRQPVSGRYVLDRGTGSDAEPVRVSFAVGDYDATLPLVIDPVLEYSSYLGWAGAEAASDIARDDAGNLYITGRTVLSMPPPCLPCIIGGSGGQDVFVAKLDPTGSTLEYVTFLGGSGDDQPAAIDVDQSGRVALGGSTDSTNFPRTYSAFSKQKQNGGASDGFVVQLKMDGTLRYSSYLGGSGSDGVADIATNGDYVKVTGNTGSTDFPVKNELQSNLLGLTDAFVVSLKMDNYNTPVSCELNTVTYNDCDDVIWSTYLGGNSFDVGHGILVDSWDIYVTGQTCSIDFPVTSKAFDLFRVGICDAFVTILTRNYPNPVSVDYSTYLGGTGWDKGNAIIASGDPAGGVLVTGETTSTNFPARDSAQLAAGGGYDAFVLRMDPGSSSSIDYCVIDGLQHDNCNDLVWSSYLGGSGAEYGYALATDFWGSAYVTGQTCSTDFPLVERLAYEPGINDGTNCDAFVSKFAPDGSALEYSTYLGGSESDSGIGIAVEKIGHAYVVGGTSSDDFPTTQNAFQATTGGGDDAFLSKLVVPCVGGGGAFAYLVPAVIDTANDCLWEDIPGETHFGVAVDPAVTSSGHAAQVYAAGGQDLWFIDPANQQAASVVTPLPQELPHCDQPPCGSNLKGVAISPDGTRAYVADHCDKYPCLVFVYDTQTHQSIESIWWGDPETNNSGAMGIALHPDGKKLYVANYHQGPAIFVIDLEANPNDLQDGSAATGIALDDTFNNVGDTGPVEIAVTPDGKWLYTANDQGGIGLSVVDATTDTFVKHIPVAEAEWLAITPRPVFLPDGYLVYTTHPNHDDLVVIRTDTHAIHETIVGAGGGEIAITPDGTKAYVAASGFVKVLDLSTSPCNPPASCATWVDSIPVGSGPAPLGSFIGPEDVDADGIIDQVDVDPNNYSHAFSDGTSNGTIIERDGLFVSVWGAFENGFYANARGGSGEATILACNITIKLDHNDVVKFLCGSLTLEVFAGQVEIGLVDEHYAAVPEGGEVKVEETFHGDGRTEGEFLLQNLGSETVSIIDAAGSTVASLAPGEAKFWPSLPSSTWLVTGIAEGGGLLLDLLGTELEVATSAGQTAGQVAYAIADAIRADPTLLGVQSTVAGNVIVITAPVDSVYSGDGGIQISVPSGIPALSPSLVALLGFAMLALGYRVVRRRNFP